MLLTNVFVKKWNPANKKRYVELGYEFTKMGDEFEVKMEDLSIKSRDPEVEFRCDVCGKIFIRPWNQYVKRHDSEFGDTCNYCAHSTKLVRTMNERYGHDNAQQVPEIHKKTEETCYEKYGGKAPACCDEVKQKTKQTWIENLGVDHPMKCQNVINKYNQTCLDRFGNVWAVASDEVRNKSEQTCFDKFGVSNPFEAKEVQDKIRQTNIENLGVDNPFKSKEVQNKIKQTNLKNLGVENPFASEEVKEKCKQTKFNRYGDECYTNTEQMLKTKQKNGTLYTHITFSKPHQYIYGLLCGLYGNDNVELEKILGTYSLDCELVINNIKIDVEYNGKYWHKGNEEYDNKRRKFVLEQDYKVFNINSGCAFPTVEQVENAINTLTTTNTQVITIDLDI